MGHVRPFFLNHDLRVAAGIELNLRSGGIRKPLGETVQIHQSIGLLVGVYICRAEAVPDVKEHESENHGISRADDA
jgi:hypothetical protein